MVILGGWGPYQLPPERLFKLIAATQFLFYKPPGLEKQTQSMGETPEKRKILFFYEVILGFCGEFKFVC
jgi:hypothetical protein